ncbi:hypothetical protein GCM10022251_63140 [Phytohabitans flavus]|uniref:DUF4178 domain-containing protein n=1 Tax=Phytohabitans flavus TaxID=1076124 RepID=A0A6F8XUY2_9ACTN|nr:DUF4178 domain-containing protein [Phytohabitans flavus]BCB77597.1 hypothetical protein Pflav_040070 [Phytohabitans flavus]
MAGGEAFLVVGLGCLAVVAGVVVAVVAVSRSRRRREAAAPAPAAASVDPFQTGDTDALRGDPRVLKPGDIVEIRTRSYAVRGSLRFTEGDWGWAEHLLDDADGTKVWMSVEEDPDLELVLWHEVPSATVTPGAPTVDFDGRRYTRDEGGRARYTGTGTTGLNPTGTVRYEDYAAPDGALLSFESYGDSGKWEVGRGEKLHRAEVLIYPQGG